MLGYYVDPLFLSLHEHPHTRRSGGAEDRLKNRQCKQFFACVFSLTSDAWFGELSAFVQKNKPKIPNPKRRLGPDRSAGGSALCM